MKQVISQVSEAISSAPGIYDYHPIHDALHILTKLKERPMDLTEVAYEWCVVIWKKYHSRWGLWDTPSSLLGSWLPSPSSAGLGVGFLGHSPTH